MPLVTTCIGLHSYSIKIVFAQVFKSKQSFKCQVTCSKLKIRAQSAYQSMPGHILNQGLKIDLVVFFPSKR